MSSEAEVIPELPAIRKGGAAPVHPHIVDDKDEPVVVKPHWYRSTLTQCVPPAPWSFRPATDRDPHVSFGVVSWFRILIVGGVFFCAPGMYNALNSLGAGGLATPWYANATAAAGYVFMAFMCICGGMLVSKIGLTRSLLVSFVLDEQPGRRLTHMCG